MDSQSDPMLKALSESVRAETFDELCANMAQAAADYGLDALMAGLNHLHQDVSDQLKTSQGKVEALMHKGKADEAADLVDWQHGARTFRRGVQTAQKIARDLGKRDSPDDPEKQLATRRQQVKALGRIATALEAIAESMPTAGEGQP